MRKSEIGATKDFLNITQLDRDPNSFAVSAALCFGILWESKYLPDSVTSGIPSLGKK